MKQIPLAAIAIIVIATLHGCKKENTSVTPDADPVLNIGTSDLRYNPEIEPEDFVNHINNIYFAQVPGDTFFYQNLTFDAGDTSVEDIYVTTTTDTKEVMGVTCKVIHDVVTEGGIITEDTYDYYAQDEDKTVWYFGEKTKKLKPNGNWSKKGSFTAGIDGALPGRVMLGYPQNQIGETYRQEYYVGKAEDKAKILNVNSTAVIAIGIFNNCLETKETTVLEPGVIEKKWYAPGTGQVLTIVTDQGVEVEREELLAIHHH